MTNPVNTEPTAPDSPRRLTPLAAIDFREEVRTNTVRVTDLPGRRPAKPITFDSAL